MTPGALIAAADGGGLIGRWSPRIGDPSLLGWCTVAAYLTTAWCCRTAALRIRVGIGAAAATAAARRERWLWRALALAFLLLGVNKQLDLQSAFTELGRMLANDEGWYAERRRVQFVFVLVIAVAGLLAAAGAAFLARGTSRAARVAVAGAALVITFVVLRAASFHHIDAFLSARWLGLKANWLLELGSIGIVFAATRMQGRPASGHAV